LDYVRASLASGLPRVARRPPRPEPLVVAGGGPSLADTFELLARQAADGAAVLAVNEVSHFLVERGLTPWAAALMGPVPHTAASIDPPHAGVRYFLASMCPPDAFAMIEGHDARLWHAEAGAGEVALMGAKSLIIDGGHTVTLRALMLGHALGFRAFHLHGADSAISETGFHAYASVSDGGESPTLTLSCDGHWYETTPELAGQAQDFPEVYYRLIDGGGELRVHGDGLLPRIWCHLAAGREAPPLLVPRPADGADSVTISASMF
jgi:hypothetical protein